MKVVEILIMLQFAIGGLALLILIALWDIHDVLEKILAELQRGTKEK